jgi:hypothetical protein
MSPVTSNSVPGTQLQSERCDPPTTRNCVPGTELQEVRDDG